jgi:hypothetical protein
MQGRQFKETCLCLAMRKHYPLAMHFVKHRNRLTEYSVLADIPRYPTRAMLALRVVINGAATAPLRRSLSEVPPGVRDTACFFLSITLGVDSGLR